MTALRGTAALDTRCIMDDDRIRVPRPEHYRILYVLSQCQTPMSLPWISWACKLSASDSRSRIYEMINPAYCHGMPWLLRIMRGGAESFSINGRKGNPSGATGGWMILQEAIEDSRLPQPRLPEWWMEVSTGMRKDGKQTTIENPVVFRKR